MSNIWITDEVKAILDETKVIMQNYIAQSGHNVQITNSDAIRLLCEGYMQRQKEIKA